MSTSTNGRVGQQILVQDPRKLNLNPAEALVACCLYVADSGNVGLLIRARPPIGELTGTAVSASIIFANALGVAVSMKLNRWKREQFAALLRPR